MSIHLMTNNVTTAPGSKAHMPPCALVSLGTQNHAMPPRTFKLGSHQSPTIKGADVFGALVPWWGMFT